MSSRGAGPHDHEPARQPTLAAYAPEPVLPPAASAPDWRSRQGRWVDRSLSGRHHLPCCRGLFRPVAKSNPCTIPRSKRQRPSYRSRPHTPNLWTVPCGRRNRRESPTQISQLAMWLLLPLTVIRQQAASFSAKADSASLLFCTLWPPAPSLSQLRSTPSVKAVDS